MIAPSLKVSFYGDGITKSESTYAVPVVEKVENSFQIRDTITKEIVLDVITNPQLLVISAEADITLTITNISSVSMAIGISANFPFILPLTASFIATLSSLDISTASTSMIDVVVRAYGNTAV